MTLKLSTTIGVAYNTFQSAINDVIYFTRHYEGVAQTLKAYNSQYLIGKRSLFDLLNIQAEVFRANETLIQAIFKQKLTAFDVLFEAGIMQQTLSK